MRSVFLVLLFVSRFVHAQDEADLARENRFHEIYKKYNFNPTPVEDWEKVTGERQSQVYKIKKNDTLWNLSKSFFGDPHYWPKLWSLNNDEVLNPHEISTWMQIRFYPGDLENPPTLAVVDKPNDTPEASFAQAENLAPSTRKIQPLMKQLPPSLPGFTYKSALPRSFKIDQSSLVRTRSVAMVSVPYFVTGNAPTVVGQIVEAHGEQKMSGQYSSVYVRLQSADMGRVYTVFRKKGEISSQNRSGIYIEVQGEIKISRAVAGSSGLYEAQVIKNINPVEVGSDVMEGPIMQVSLHAGQVDSSAPAMTIIGSDLALKRTTVDASGFFTLDRGAQDGIQLGQVVNLYANNLKRNKQSVVFDSEKVHGKAQIVHVSDAFAVGLVLETKGEIYIGDFAGARPSSSDFDFETSESSENNSSSEKNLSEATQDSEFSSEIE